MFRFISVICTNAGVKQLARSVHGRASLSQQVLVVVNRTYVDVAEAGPCLHIRRAAWYGQALVQKYLAHAPYDIFVINNDPAKKYCRPNNCFFDKNNIDLDRYHLTCLDDG